VSALIAVVYWGVEDGRIVVEVYETGVVTEAIIRVALKGTVK